jgi:ABC-2 type transport system ATP-binding protein
MLEIKNLVKIYAGPITALAGVNLMVPNGLFGLLGPNGAGKTTLMKIVAGLLEPTSGSVSLDGHDILSDAEFIWRQLGSLPQEFGFYPHLTGEAMLVYLLRLKGIEHPGGLKRLARELLARVNLEFAAKRKIKSYSGGMRQRLGIAQAIAGRPRILIVDEPTAGLDPEERIRFYRLLADLAEERIVLLSTHIVEDVAVLCPRFVVIREGKLITETSPSEAKKKMNGSIYEGSVRRDQLQSISSKWCVTQSVLVEGQHRVRVYEPQKSPPEGFVQANPTLEDAYLVLMKTNGISPAGGAQ